MLNFVTLEHFRPLLAQPSVLYLPDGSALQIQVQGLRPAPVQAQYGARLKSLEAIETPRQPLRGVVLLQGRSESVLGTAWRRAAALGVRESGF